MKYLYTPFLRNVRFFSKISYRFQTSSPTISSPVFNNNRVSLNSFSALSIDEDTIIELLINISDNPVLLSNRKFVTYDQLPYKPRLPQPPRNINEKTVKQYVDELINNQYPKKDRFKISEIILKQFSKYLELFDRDSFLSALRFLHYVKNDKSCFQLLGYLPYHDTVAQDIHFDNVLLSKPYNNAQYKFVIERLERLAHFETKANCDTWYNVYTVLKRSGPKMKMLELMEEYKVSIKPISDKLLPVIHHFTPESLNEFYQKCDIDLKNMNSDHFNQLISCYLNNNQINKAWNLTKSRPDLINKNIYTSFLNHFLENNQLPYAIAFSKFFKQKYNITTLPILVSNSLNYLSTCDYFDNWLQTTKFFISKLKIFKGLANDQQMESLYKVAKKHDLSTDFDNSLDKDIIFYSLIDRNLTWNDEPIFKFEKNDEKFKKTAKSLGQTK